MSTAKTHRELAAYRRALVERLWSEGVSAKEIARQAGWSTKSSLSAYRAKGWDLPHRHSPERVKAYTEGRWG